MPYLCSCTMSDLSTLKNQLSRKDLFDIFKAQLIKDFEQCNFPADFVAHLQPDYAEILERIASELQRNERKSDFSLSQLLYRVDISETQLNKYLAQKKNEGFYHVVAELLIKRVLQKVVIRKYYRNKGSS